MMLFAYIIIYRLGTQFHSLSCNNQHSNSNSVYINVKTEDLLSAWIKLDRQLKLLREHKKSTIDVTHFTHNV